MLKGTVNFYCYTLLYNFVAAVQLNKKIQFRLLSKYHIKLIHKVLKQTEFEFITVRHF